MVDNVILGTTRPSDEFTGSGCQNFSGKNNDIGSNEKHYYGNNVKDDSISERHQLKGGAIFGITVGSVVFAALISILKRIQYSH
jgi:hypothetical protein